MPDNKNEDKFMIYAFKEMSPQHSGFVKMINERDFTLNHSLYESCITLFSEDYKMDFIINILDSQNYMWRIFKY